MKNKINSLDKKVLNLEDFKLMFNIDKNLFFNDMIKSFESNGYVNEGFEIYGENELNNIETFLENINEISNLKYNISIKDINNGKILYGYFDTLGKFSYKNNTKEINNKLNNKLIKNDIKLLDKLIKKIIIDEKDLTSLEEELINYSNIEIINEKDNQLEIFMGMNKFKIKYINNNVLLFNENELIKKY